MLLHNGKPLKNVSGDQFVFLVASGFTRPNMSELLRIKKQMVEKRVSMFRAVSLFVCFFFLVSSHAHCFYKSTFPRLFCYF